MKATYNPGVFDVQDEQQAKNIILTNEGSTTEERWQKETPFLSRDIGEFIRPNADKLILDFGCGIGRICKALIDSYQCHMLGVDISSSMRELSLQYVKHKQFTVTSPDVLISMLKNGLRVDACVSLWVLQHCPNLMKEVDLIKALLKPGGYFYVLNNNMPAIPTDKGWVNDGVNIKPILEKEFIVLEYSSLPEDCCPSPLREHTFIAKMQKRWS